MTAYPLLNPAQWTGYSGAADAYPGYKSGSKFCQTAYAGHEWDVLSAKKPWSITAPDANTVRLELRQGDQTSFDIEAKSGSERCELAASYDGMYQIPKGPGRPPILTPAYVSFGITIEPGPTNTASWLVLAQFHEDEVQGSPPISLCLAAGSDVMTVNKGWMGSNGKPTNGPIWTDTAPLVRGQRYQIDMWMRVDPAGVGLLVVYRDGVKIIDHQGPIGYTGQTNSFWKFGPYRHGPTPETIAVRYDAMRFGWGAVGAV